MFKDAMSPKERVLAILGGREADRAATVNLTSVATLDSMAATGASFPGAHLDAGEMAALASAAHTELGFDSIMPKFGVTHAAAALGAIVDWRGGADMPVVTGRPVKDPEDFRMPGDFLDRGPVAVVLEAIKALKARYGDTVAIVGKVMGPWTCAYNLYGTESFLMDTASEPERARAFLEAFSPIGLRFAMAQLEAGADLIVWCDHATGDLCGAEAYRELLLPVHKRLFGELRSAGRPTVLHVCGKTLDRIGYFAESGADAFHFDSRNDVGAALAAAGSMVLAGCVNNDEVLLKGTPESVAERTAAILKAGIRLVSPECAVPCRTPNANLRAIAETVRAFGGGR
ncbi:MAG: MtaA/CmuA family methyltransferase [Oscillospiraceae bacterium]|nr:MtaA/CmuA family methyltransferase [Oscillospiraceae bacterium]